jgi:hypothetical protein
MISRSSGRSTLRPVTAVCCLVLFAAPSVHVTADEDAESKRASRLKAMHELVEDIKIYSGEGDDRAALQLVPDPLVRYSDAPHVGLKDATVWMWCRGERPVALLKLELYPGSERGPFWSYCCTSVSSDPIDGHFVTGVRPWSTTSSGSSPQWLPDAGSPAATADHRLRQMRDIWRRFTAYRRYLETGRTELRRLTQPIHRYKSEDDGIVDGAIFCMAKDTNPHVWLLIECVKDGEAPRWRYMPVRHADAECHLLLDDREVWKVDERFAVDPRQPYFWFQTPVRDLNVTAKK